MAPCQARRNANPWAKRLSWAARGLSFMIPSSTGSIPRASAGRESVTRLSHSSCTGTSGICAKSSTVAKKMVIISPMLQESR